MKKRFEDLLVRMGLKREAGLHQYEVDANLYAEVVELAEEEQITPDEMASELVRTELAKRRRNAELWQRWQTLTPNEQNVIAFSCLGYTNRQIAAKMGISHETVKWYVRKLLVKLSFNSKYEFKVQFRGWDFSKWGPEASD
jgi:DNA-binding CsgD family transcriptional regulator